MTDLYEQARVTIASAQDHAQNIRGSSGTHSTIDALLNELASLNSIVQAFASTKPYRMYRLSLDALNASQATMLMPSEKDDNPFARGAVKLRLERSEWEALGRPATLDVSLRVHHD